MYHLRNRLQYADRERVTEPIDSIERSIQKVRRDRWRCFMLLGENFEVIGYTVYHGE